ncbi:ketopantoate reductase PanE/ApbA C terminal-domain-containing protein [Dactylonectria macrodidyma]|uniref:2-dehydropantoate 2-reductase n=1 Tax=Dactylonectria macrodidyma TaxID=307937 RepID=A0A9P9J4A1_9HYPO|nr:ketopantoate reductase PanE/ApbA C terminal-domain-containing protein [Dactylonectria macrodidyma]
MSHEASHPRVHVLGLGSIGTFAAHSLAEVPSRPAVTLLMHRPSLVDQFRKNGEKITLKTREGETVSHDNYNIESYDQGQWHRVSAQQAPTAQSSIIENLIVSVKATQTVSALRPVQQRLNNSSNILFLQNGSGMIEDVNISLFPDKTTRPNYIIGVISHGVTLNSPFDITHTGFSATSIGPVPREGEPANSELDAARPSYLLGALPLVSRFNATAYSFLDVFQIQLEKLAVNAFCNPLCALNNAKNGFLFTISETRRALLEEISRVILALPELQGVAGVEDRFSPDTLEATVHQIITNTAETTCSMVVDLRQGRETEIQYINGFWCKRGRSVGVPTPMNDDLVRRITELHRK